MLSQPVFEVHRRVMIQLLEFIAMESTGFKIALMNSMIDEFNQIALNIRYN